MAGGSPCALGPPLLACGPRLPTHSAQPPTSSSPTVSGVRVFLKATGWALAPKLAPPSAAMHPLQNYELILHSGTHKVVQRGPGGDLPYRIRYMGTHLAVETRSGLLVSWDRKTSVFIRLHQDYKVRAGPLRPGHSPSPRPEPLARGVLGPNQPAGMSKSCWKAALLPGLSAQGFHAPGLSFYGEWELACPTACPPVHCTMP